MTGGCVARAVPIAHLDVTGAADGARCATVESVASAGAAGTEPVTRARKAEAGRTGDCAAGTVVVEEVAPVARRTGPVPAGSIRMTHALS